MSEYSMFSPGLGGFLAARDRHAQQQAQQMAQAASLAGLLHQQEQMQMARETAPLQRSLLEAQVARAQAQVKDEQKKQEFFKNIGQFMTPGVQEIPAPSVELGGGPGRPGEAPKMDFERLIPAAISAGAMNPEVMINRQMQREQHRETLQATLEQKREQANQLHESRMLQAQTAAERAAETARHNKAMEVISGQLVALRREASGGAGSDRRTPESFSINGVNVKGSVDRFGNYYGPDGKVVTGQQKPLISPEDETARRNAAETTEATRVVSNALGRMRQLVEDNPNTVAGLYSVPARLWDYAREQTYWPGGRPGKEFDQLIEAALVAAGKAGKISNQQSRELREMFASGTKGDVDSVKKGIAMFEAFTGIKAAGANIASGRVRSGPSPAPSPSANIPPPPPGFKVD